MGGVLIVTNEQDLAADLVVLELHRRGIEVLRCNTERLPRWRVRVIPGRSWRLTNPRGRTASSHTTASVWWRRPEAPRDPAGSAGSRQSAFAAQWQAMLEGLVSVSGPRWLSSPVAIRAAEDKARQLAVAAQVGFRVPQTLWTNDVSAVRELVTPDCIVAKPVTAAAWEDEHGAAFVFAERLARDELPTEDGLALAPAAFQQLVWPKRDVRVTVVGDRVIAATIAPNDADRLDWRLEPDRPWSPYALDARDAARCRELVRALGLRFGGIDLVIDADRQPWFLEINPNGEWGWLAQSAEVPVVEALVDDLTLSDAI